MTPERLKELLAGDRTDAASDLDILNEQELEVFSLLSQGYSAGQIHSEFGIAPAQVQALENQIQRKFKLKNKVELIRFIARRARVAN